MDIFGRRKGHSWEKERETVGRSRGIHSEQERNAFKRRRGIQLGEGDMNTREKDNNGLISSNLSISNGSLFGSVLETDLLVNLSILHIPTEFRTNAYPSEPRN